MYTLYTGKYTRGLMVEMVMAEGDIEYRREDVDITRGEERSAGFLAINPAGWVPALKCPGGELLIETPAINLFLCERHRITSLAPATDDPDRGVFLSALFYITDEIEPTLKRYWYPHYFGDDDHTAPAIEKRAIESVLHGFGIVDQRLAASGPCHLGERFSLPDLMIAYWAMSFATTAQLAEAFDALANIRRCIDIARARPKLAPLFDLLDAWNHEFDGI